MEYTPAVVPSPVTCHRLATSRLEPHYEVYIGRNKEIRISSEIVSLYVFDREIKVNVLCFTYLLDVDVLQFGFCLHKEVILHSELQTSHGINTKAFDVIASANS